MLEYDELDDRIDDLEYDVINLNNKVKSLDTDVNNLLLMHGYQKNTTQKIVIKEVKSGEGFVGFIKSAFCFLGVLLSVKEIGEYVENKNKNKNNYI